MPKLYCMTCEKGTSYEITKPKFCSHCSKPYVPSEASFKPIEIKSNTNKVKRQIVIDNEDEEINDNEEQNNNYEEIPQIDKLKFDIQGGRDNREDITQVIKQQPLGIRREKVRQKGKVKKPSEKDFQKNWASNFSKSSRENPTSLGE